MPSLPRAVSVARASRRATEQDAAAMTSRLRRRTVAPSRSHGGAPLHEAAGGTGDIAGPLHVLPAKST